VSARTGPLQNRVTPYGELVAAPERGTLFGNRGGRLHRDDRSLGRARWRSKSWIACLLAFKGRHRTVFGAGYTELFFLDEATALAAGHRPCAECRRADFNRFAAAWARAHGTERPRAPEMDAGLHHERCAVVGRDALPEVEIATLADGAMIERDGAPHLVLGGRLLPWSHAGYGPGRPRPAGGTVRLITPPALAAALAAGYRPALHASASGI